MNDLFPGLEIQYWAPSSSFLPNLETSSFQINPSKNSYSPSDHLTVFTDGGSHADYGVDSAFCAMKGNVVKHQWSRRLDDRNSI